MNQIFTTAWWKSAGVRAFRTAIIVAVPYLPASLTNNVPYVTILGAAVMGGFLSLLTSLAGLAEVEGRVVPWYFALLERVVKTTAQALVTALTATVFITEVDWHQVLAITSASAFGSLLLGILKVLPESEDPADSTGRHLAVTATPNSTVIVNNSGSLDASQIEVNRSDQL